MMPVLVSSGEPAGIGPDLCCSLAFSKTPLVILGDVGILTTRARELKLDIHCKEYQLGRPVEPKAGTLWVLPVSCPKPVKPGFLDPANAAYVMEVLRQAATLCQQQVFSALVTAPVHKANINAAGIPFTGHTEFFAEFYGVETVVMMLACEEMKVALATTHLPLRDVANTITIDLLIKIIKQLDASLRCNFGISRPYIKVAGLNPHAGESGYLGREEIDIIEPALAILKKQGLCLDGPLPADTMFRSDLTFPADAYVAMYHDQGLPVLKYAGFHRAVNVSLGLPIIRTSVDHGTALDLAGKALANTDSMQAAVNMAVQMTQKIQISH